MRLNPHLHTIALDGAWSEQGNELVFSGLGHLKTSEVGEVLEQVVRRIERHLDRRGLLGTRDDDLDLSGEGDPESNLASSAVSGQSPPAGPQSPKGRLRAGRLDCSPSGPGTCPSCQGRMRLLAVVKNPAGMARGQAFASLKGGFALARYLAAAGELTEVPERSPPRAPPYWKSQVLRRQALGGLGEGGDDRADHEAA